MAALKLKKMTWLRKRFAKSKTLFDLNEWMDLRESLSQKIQTDSSFQVVEGHKNIIEFSSKTGNAAVLIEVVGVPRDSVPTFDHAPCEVLIYDYPANAFQVDFDTLKKEAELIRGKLSQPLGEVFHIVFDGNHLALHFFIQKDYIQTT